LTGNLDGYGIIPTARDVFEKTSDKKPVEWSLKQKRTFRNLLSGVKVTKLLGSELKFLTLTTSDVCKNQIGYNDNSLSRDWIRLKQRIERVTPYKLYKWGYLSKRQIAGFYGRGNYLKPIVGKIEYCKVVTNEGNGVIHLLMRCGYLPHSYLVSEWMDIHLSWNVNIRDVPVLEKESSDVASYIVSQYVANQKTSYVRGSQSKRWIFPGSSKTWKDCLHSTADWKNQYKNEYGIWTADYRIDKAIKEFNKMMKWEILGYPPEQSTLDKYLT